MDQKDFKHISVLFKETVDGLNVTPGGIYVDGTLGGAGHAKSVCEQFKGATRKTIPDPSVLEQEIE